jgi:hypothetical protein
MPDRAEIEAVARAMRGVVLAGHASEWDELAVAAIDALDRVRDARDDDEGLPDCEHGYFAAGGTDTCPACDADALDYLERRKAEAARSPQGEDHAPEPDALGGLPPSQPKEDQR